jgi:hypothetical protein
VNPMKGGDPDRDLLKGRLPKRAGLRFASTFA